jgi:uncharacterized protein YecE (DUF72 family)
MKPGKPWIGTSGYQYDHWRGVLYPEGLPKRAWFSRYAEVFDTVEINNTFYRLPEEKTFEAWREKAPEGFCYTLKYSRYGTHVKKLKEPEKVLSNFLSRAEKLRGLLGPILVQLPPSWKANPPRLAGFLKAAPRKHRWAVEFRDASWLTEEVFDILKQNRAALCVHDMLPDHPQITTSDWVYLRFHGGHYEGSYSHEVLTSLADRIARHLREGRDVYAYFNNDLGGHAVRNALDLKRSLDRIA